MNRFIKGLVGAFLGYCIAFVLWIIVFWLNQMFYPNQFTELWRFIVWMIGIGTLWAVPLSILFYEKGSRKND